MNSKAATNTECNETAGVVSPGLRDVIIIKRVNHDRNGKNYTSVFMRACQEM